LRLAEDPLERIGIPAPAVCGCGTFLVEDPVLGVRRRQVHDLAPMPALVVTEYAAEVKHCPGCARTVVGEFPARVGAPAPAHPT
jgi:hypothetical protein